MYPVTYYSGQTENPVPDDRIMINRTVNLSTDPQDATAKGLREGNSMVQQMEQIMTEFGEDNNKGYRPLHWIEQAPAEFKITDDDLEFPITSDWVKRMYDPSTTERFYLFLTIGNSGHRDILQRIKTFQAVSRIRKG